MQNLVSTHFSVEQWTQADQTLTQLELAFAPLLVALSADALRHTVRMGDGSEAFVRKSGDVMAENRALLPPSLDVDEMRRDIATHDALNTRLARLLQLVERIRATEIALGSDAMVAALEGYAFLKIAGKGEGLQALRRDLGKRFEGNGRRGKNEPVPAAA